MALIRVFNGAVAVIFPCGDPKVYDTPTIRVESSGKIKNKYDTAAMANLLISYKDSRSGPARGPDVLVILEAVHSLPKQGVASSFTFGEGLGMWKGIIAAYGLPLEMVSPQRWKKEIMADQGREKSASRYKAVQIFPQVADRLSRIKDDGRAEALLLAEYGRRLRKE